MQAIVVHAFGPPESLRIDELAAPVPGPGEVHLRTYAAGVSFFDTVMAAGRYQVRPALPFIPGSELSGTVLAVGAGVTRVAPGDLAYGGRFNGIFAQELIMPESNVHRLPPGADLATAAVFYGNYITVWHALIDRGGLEADETLLVLGAGGGVGIAACQLGAHLGATVIASASSEAKRALALANGARYAIDSGAPDWRDQIKALTGNRGIDVVVDPVGGAQTERAFRSLGWQGRQLIIGFAGGSIPSIATNLALVKGISLIGVDTLKHIESEPEAVLRARDQLMQLFIRGVLTTPVAKIYPFEEFAAAMSEVAAGQTAGRIILRFS
jgi:NADPH:quinone reductase